MRIPAILLVITLKTIFVSNAQVHADGLVGYWPFNGGVQDEGPNHLPTLPHRVAWTEDRFGRPNSAIYLNDAQRAYVEVPDHPALHLYNFSYSFWILMDHGLNNDVFFIAKRLEKPANRFSIAVYPRNYMLNTFICDSVGNENYFHSLSLWAPQLHTWHCLAVVGDYRNLSYWMYIDGELAGRADLNIAAAYDHHPLTFGVWAFNDRFGDFFRGKLDDIRIYKRALTPEEVRRIAADRPGGKAIGTDWMRHELPDGRYVAHFTERNNIISAAPYLFELKQQQPFWHNRWFLGGGVLVAVLLALLAQHLRHGQKLRTQQLELDRLKAVEQERSRIARDLHDDLGSGLSAIGLLTEIARQKSRDPGLDAEIRQMAATSAALSRKIREIIWLVSARFDHWENLVSYLNHFAVELFADSSTELEVQLPAETPAATLGGEQRRAFFQSVKTALLLLHKHAPIHLRLAFSPHLPFSVTIQYDGPDYFSTELGPAAELGQTLMKLRQTGGAFEISGASPLTLRFSLKPNTP